MVNEYTGSTGLESNLYIKSWRAGFADLSMKNVRDLWIGYWLLSDFPKEGQAHSDSFIHKILAVSMLLCFLYNTYEMGDTSENRWYMTCWS